jgi:hypothetical protein
VVPLPFELQVDPAVGEPFGVQPGAEADRAEHLRGSGFEQPGALARLAVGPAAILDHHRVDAAERQQVGKQQPGRAGSDDADLRARGNGHNAFQVSVYEGRTRVHKTNARGAGL